MRPTLLPTARPRTLRASARVALLPLAILVLACRPEVEHRNISPPALGYNLREVRTQILQETSSAYLGRPVGLFVDGSTFVSIDGFSTRVLAFARDGSLKWISGRAGSGPGEFQAPSYFAARNDSELFVVDMSLRRLTTLRRDDGKYVRQRNIDGTPTYAFGHADSLLLGLAHYANKSSAALLVGDGPPVFYGPLPNEYLKVPAMALLSMNSIVTMWGDTTALVLAGKEQLFLLKTGGAILDSLALPRMARRGVPAVIPPLTRSADAVKNIFGSISLPWSIHRLPSGTIAVVHQDIDVIGKRLTNALFITLISLNRREACVDASLAVSQEGQAQIAFIADTAFVLDQLVPDSGTAQTRIRTLVVDESECRWTPITAPSGRTQPPAP